MKSKDSESRKVAVRSLKRAGSAFGIKGLASSDHAVRLIEHFMTNVECWSTEDYADQRAQELGNALFSIGMAAYPDQFGADAKASTECLSEDRFSTGQSDTDDRNVSDAMKSLREIRSAMRRMGLPEDYFIRRNCDFSPHSEFETHSGLLNQSPGNRLCGYRPPVIEPQRLDAYTFAEDPNEIMMQLVEAAQDEDILDRREMYAKLDGPASTGAEAARELCVALDRDRFFIRGNKKQVYKSPWTAISELLSLVGCDMSADQVRQACSDST